MEPIKRGRELLSTPKPPDLSPAAWLLLLRIAEEADDMGMLKTSIRRLATGIGISAEYARVLLRQLEDKGRLQRIVNIREDGSTDSNTYQLLFKND